MPATAGACRLNCLAGRGFREVRVRADKHSMCRVKRTLRPRPASRGSAPWLAALALAALAAGGPARAEDRKDSYEVGVFAGEAKYGNELQLETGAELGLRFGWHFAPPYTLEFQYLQGTGVHINGLDSTLIANDAVFINNKGRKYSPTFYTARLLISPSNDRRRFKPYAQFGAGFVNWSASPTLASSDRGTDSATLVSLGGGFKFRVGAYTQLRAEMEDLYAVKAIYSNIQANVGVAWVFGGGKPADSDGDGVLDIRDRCPDTPKGALVDKHDGCPWDLDGDGVMEGLDQCANTPQGWPVDAKGCPLDSDADGVPDGLDKCADTPKGAIIDSTGCPTDSDKDGIFDGIDRCPGTPIGAIVDPADSPTAGCTHDTDNDGVPDGVDQCALTPPGATVDEKGCPKDSDGDRVLDGLDQCPDTPRGQKIDKEGCPRVRLDKDEPEILSNVKFHGMELYPGTDAWLELLVEAANYWPDVVFEVAVYTDNEGGIASNKAAAQRRAEVVKGWLVQHGIAATRFVMKAPGPVKFIADNATEEGRDKNRRVEVRRLSGDTRRHPKPEPEPAPEAKPKPETPPETPPGAPAEPPATPPAPAVPGEEKPPAPVPPAPAPAPEPPPPQPENPPKPPDSGDNAPKPPGDQPQPAPDSPQPPPPGDAPKPPGGGR